MTEKQKMLNGNHYNTRDNELIADYHHAKKWLQQFNHAASDDATLKENCLKQLLQFKGNGVWIEAPFYCDYGYNIAIGNNSFINANCVFLDSNLITIGKNALIAPSVQIYTATHPLKATERIINDRYITYALPVAIGDNVWIGGNTVIFPGVTIGNNVTIGAGSVVTKNIPDNVLAYGNPCKIIKEI